ncbi:MAG: hypothetical protein AABZ44_04285, partial [Elusimicrobiota bacterium]
GQIVKKQLQDVGIDMDIHLSKDAQGVQDIASRQWDVYIGGCPDPMVHNFFVKSIFFYGKSPYVISKDAIFDAALEDMAMTLDSGQRIAKARSIDKRLQDEALGIFMYQRIKTYGVNKKVHFVPSVTGMSYFFRATKEAR